MLAVVPKAKRPAVSPGQAQINLKMPEKLLEDIDEWVEEINLSRSWPKVTRSDVIRGVMAQAVRKRIDWEESPEPPPAEPRPPAIKLPGGK